MEWLLFVLAFVAFGYFHQGGGWNQNGRFAMVRAMVEERRFAIDSYMIYINTTQGRFDRVPINNGMFSYKGRDTVLVWNDAAGKIFPVNNVFEGLLTDVDLTNHTIRLRLSNRRDFTVGITADTEILRDGRPAKLERALEGMTARIELRTEPERRGRARRVELVSGAAPRDVNYEHVDNRSATGDVAFALGHFHPNKAPGTSFVTALGYLVVYAGGRLIGTDFESWWSLTRNAWLTTALSVGLLSALGCVLFFRLSLQFCGERRVPALLSTLSFAFGTMYFTYATMLFEHNIIAVALLASFALLYKVKKLNPEDAAERPAWRGAATALILAGFCAGYAAITNYIVAPVIVILLLYLIASLRQRLGWLWFGAGALIPFLAICAYNQICFGTPFTTNYAHQNPMFFSEEKALLGVFLTPQSFSAGAWEYLANVAGVLAAVLVSPSRGLFFSAPVLLVGVVGLFWMLRDDCYRAEAWLMLSILGFFFLFIAHFNGWHGGWASGPRYLLPAIPFLALPMAPMFARFTKASCTLAAVSIAITVLTVAVDAMEPLGLDAQGFVYGRPSMSKEPVRASFAYNPVTEYFLPFFLTGRDDPIVRQNIEAILSHQEQLWIQQGIAPDARQRLRLQLISDTERGESQLISRPLGLTPLALATIRSHVSVNPMGIYEGSWYREFPARSLQAEWNAFNAGEFLFPKSPASLLLLLITAAGLIVPMFRGPGATYRSTAGQPRWGPI